MPETKAKMPRLEALFFDTCRTAIRNCAWRYQDFEKVKHVEGQLDALEAFLIDLYAREALLKVQPSAEAAPVASSPIPALQDKPEVPTSEVKTEPIQEATETKPMPEVTSEAIIPTEEKVLTPEEVKKAPVKPMPEDILEVVKVGVEVAKDPPKVRDVKVSDIPDDPDAARQAWNKPF